MIKINLSGKSNLNTGLKSAQAYKERIKETFAGNKNVILSMMKKFGVPTKTPTVRRDLMGIEGSGYEETQGRGYNDKVYFDPKTGKVGVEYNTEKMERKRIWVIEFIRAEAKKLGL